MAADPAILTWAREHDVAFEVCPTSNVLTGAATSVQSHPIHAFMAAGCRVVLGDDDPVTTGSTLSSEVRRLVSEGGLTDAALAAMQRTAVEVGFMDESTRTMLRAQVA